MQENRFGIAILLALCASTIFGQEKTTVLPEISPPRFREFGDVVSLLQNSSVRNELHISNATAKAITEIDEQLTDTLAATTAKLGTGNSIGFHDVVATVNASKTIATENLRSLLTTSQIDRLSQITYYVEIAYIGLPQAITDGRLGEDIGVHDNQKERLRLRGQEIFSQTAKDIRALKEKLHGEVMHLLTEAQQTKWQQLFGPFFLCEDARSASRRVAVRDNADRRKLNSELDEIFNIFGLEHSLFVFLRSKPVRDELAFSKEETELLNSFVTKVSNASRENVLKYMREASEAIDELLIPSQRERLQQISYYLEIESYGYAAIYGTRIGKILGIDDTQKTTLSRRIKDLEELHSKEILTYLSRQQGHLLNELSPDQKNRARTLLGEFFVFEDPNIILQKERIASDNSKSSVNPHRGY